MTIPYPTEPKPSRWRSLVLGVFVGLALIVGSVLGGGWLLHSWAERPAFAKGTEPENRTGDAALVVACMGAVDVEGGILSLAPTLPGRVAKVFVQENDPVQAGQVLLQLDEQTARFHVEEAKASLQASEALLAKTRKAPQQHRLLLAQQKATLAATERERAAAHHLLRLKEKLHKTEFLGKEEVEAALEATRKMAALEQLEQAKLSALELLDPSLDVVQAEADVSAKKVQLEKAQYALGEHTLKAPLEGTILRLLVQSGEVLGAQPRQPILLFAPHKPRIVRAEVEQEFTGRLALGQHAVIQDDTRGTERTWTGTVTRIDDWFAQRRTILPATLPMQEVRTLECQIKLDQSQPPLRIGQRVRVKLFRAE